jgi:hypothetical protein
MSTLSSLVLVCAALCCGCSATHTALDGPMPDSGAPQTEPRGIVGEPCPPALAAKAYC